MKLYGQRWEFRIGNTLVKVDNAFSWSLWGQERMLVNDEVAHASGGRWRFSQKYREPWLSQHGEGELKVWLRSTSTGIRCTALLNGEEVAPDAILEASWRGSAQSWPQESEWRPQDPRRGWAA